jgi:hypothetical protein
MNKVQIVFNRGYRVSEDGTLTNPKGVRINGRLTNNGYREISFKINGKDTRVAVHRLQAYQKYGERIMEPGIEVRHLNGNRLDNSSKNIAIGTHSDNMRDIPRDIRLANAKYAASFNRKYDAAAVKEFYQTHGFMRTLRHFKMTSKGTLHAVLHR